MERKNFLKLLGIGAATAVVSPSSFIKKENTKFIDIDDLRSHKPVPVISKAKHDDEDWNMWCTTTAGDCTLYYAENEGFVAYTKE
jgi:hypothetical protein